MGSWNDTIGQTIDLIQDGKDIFSNQYVILALTFAAFLFMLDDCSSVQVGCYSILF